jgi:ABC-type polysaccharide/polyol phosphate export permease
MIETRKNRTLIEAAGSYIELIYHSIVRDIRKSSGSASLGLLAEIATTLMMIGMFYALYTFIGLKGMAIRGDFVVFLLTGIFLYLTHNKAITAVMSAANAASPIMKHAPMTTIVSILSSAFAALYLQIIAFAIILFFVHVLRGGLEFYDPAGLILPFFLSWASGCTIGLLFMVVMPLAPRLVGMIAQLYKRANMITSGKMLPANLMSASMVQWFDWNPLFHTIDQSRGYAFVNYFPRNSNMEYPIYFILAALMIGLLGERWLTKNISVSWGKR